MRQVEQSLLGFQKGLLGVEREMLPVYKLTEQLRGTQKNIDLSVLELRQINENFVAAHQVQGRMASQTLLRLTGCCACYSSLQCY